MAAPLDPVVAVRRLGGRARTAQITGLTTRWALREAIRTGGLVRVARGVYALPGAPTTLATAAATRGSISHLSAAAVWGLSLVREPGNLHVTVPHGSRRLPREGITVHRTRHLRPDEVRGGVTAPLRTVLDCATSLPFAEALAVADSALARGVVRPGELRLAASAARGPGRRALIGVALAADGRAANAFESVLRAVLLEAGIAGFQPQLEIRLGRRPFRVDLGDRDLMIAIEADSFEFHGSREALERDCERYDTLTAAG